MAEDLIKACEQLKLSDLEEKVVTFEDDEEETKRQQMELRLIGKLLTNKPFSTTAMKNTLSLVWKPQHGLAIREVESNLFVFQFFSDTDKLKVMNGRPWTFNDYLVLLKEFDGMGKSSEIIFDESPLWIKVYDIPLQRRKRRTAEIIGNHMGCFLEYDDYDVLGVDRTLKVKVQFDIKKHLPHGITMDVGGVPKWFDIKNVRLPILCFKCGILGHVEKECPILNEDGNKVVANQFGQWMQASPLKTAQKMNSKEREKEMAWILSLKERGRRRKAREKSHV